MTFPITKDYLPVHTKLPSRRTGRKLVRVQFLVAHDIGVINSDADNNVRYYQDSARLMSASAHTFIDDVQIIECIPLDEKAWHVLYDRPKDNQMYGIDANDGAIGVELCYFTDKNRTRKAYEKYIWYLAHLCVRFKLQPSRDIVGHHILDPGRKTDPVNALSTIGKTYAQFLADVQAEYNRQVAPPKKEEPKVAEYAKDAKPSPTLAPELQKAIEAKITDGTYPTRPMTRQEGAVMNYRVYKKVMEEVRALLEKK